MALVASHDWSNDMDGTRQQQQQQQQQQRTHPSTSDSQNIPNGVSQQQQQPQQPQQQQQSPAAYAQGPYGFAHPQQASPAWHMGGMGQMNLPHGQPTGYFPQMPFYPQHYPQQPQQLPYGQPAPHMFDPNARFAQWAYQQMMFNAQQQQQSHQMSLPQQQPQQGGGRGRSGSATTSNAGTPTNEYYQTPFGGHSRFQQSSPPTGQQSGAGGQYQGFHPYRRPDRGERRPHNDNNHASSNNSIPFQPPYARSDATGSSTSVNSSSSTSHRSRTNSGTSASGSAGARPAFNQQNSSGNAKHTPRQASTSSSITTTTSASIGPRSSSSSTSTLPSSPLSSSPIVANPTSRTSRPSPLSQGSILSAAERRKSRDDSDLAAMFNSAVNLNDSSPATPTTTPRSGLKGRLRRALSLGAAATLREEDEDNNSKVNGKKKEEPVDGDSPDAASMATKKTKKSLRMFNSRFNASTDNISLSSTVSSASVMIRKLGSMGRLARRNSLAGITSLFKDKDKNKDGCGEDAGEVSDSKGKKAKGKAKKADASVTLATAEVDRSNEWSGPGMEGLSPAAKLARQHTLKSNAEAAARAKAQQEAQAASAAEAAAAASSTASTNGVNGEMLPTTWERNTTTRHGANLAGGSAREDGMRVVVEEDSDEGEGEENEEMMRHKMDEFLNSSDDDSTWHGHEEEDEDATVRLGQRPPVIDEDGLSNGHGHADDDNDVLDEPWAVNCRRSIERNLKPTRGILKKNTVNYQTGEQPIGPNAAFMQRSRANSYDSVPSHQTERGPLAHGPPSDPDAMDKLRRRNSARSTNSAGKENNATGINNGGGPPLLPPLHFDSTQGAGFAPALSTSHSQDSEKRSSVFNHPGLNNSEPALSTMLSSPPTLSHRSATTPAKRLAFAANLSIYDTFSSSTYDRRSEPATWSRLTPALAQRIKEELNSYKMEEMEVHAASRIHTQFHI